MMRPPPGGTPPQRPRASSMHIRRIASSSRGRSGRNVKLSAGAPPAESFTMRPLRPREELAILRMCVEEARGLCGGVLPGGGRIISCLARNASQLSPQCRAAMAEARN